MGVRGISRRLEPRGRVPADAARREAAEEAGLSEDTTYYRLQSKASVPRYHFGGRTKWPSDLLVVVEHSFAADCSGQELALSSEHTEVAWGSYTETYGRLHWDSNKVALWELQERLPCGVIPGSRGLLEMLKEPR